jgi:hypothetical protein
MVFEICDAHHMLLFDNIRVLESSMYMHDIHFWSCSSFDHMYLCFMGTERCWEDRNCLYLCIKQTCEKPCKKIFDEGHAKSWYSHCNGVLDGICYCRVCYEK